VTADNDTKTDMVDSHGLALPAVVVVCYNRPTLTLNLVSVLRRVRPSHVLIVADGPKQGDFEDKTSVESTRAVFDQIDWPCKVDRLYSDVNLGCTARIASGLDWAFDLVDEAIILEDDIEPSPQFFSWANQLLKLYRDRDDIAMISGHNPLISWPEFISGSFAIPSRRGAIWGWATWAHAWHSVRSWSVDGGLESVARDISKSGFEPALAALYQLYLAEARTRPLSWDVDFTIRMAMSGRRSLVSPKNYVHHLGVGPDATHHKDGDDTLFYLPRGEGEIPEILLELPKDSVDLGFDRARVMMELLVRTKNPLMARLLAKHVDLPIEEEIRTHLLPFLFPDEIMDLLTHLEDEGLDQARARYWKEAVGGGKN
jgi:hypothetical protein